MRQERAYLCPSVFFQRFAGGELEPGGGELMRKVLQPFILRQEPPHHFALVEFGDGSADVYLHDDHMIANHISGEEPWELLVRGARAAGWVIMAAAALRASPTKRSAATYRTVCKRMSPS